MAMILNGTGDITGLASVNASVSAAEIGYLDGVNSALQPQINTAGGLVKITDNTFSGSSAVNVNNCFTSTYENYLVTIFATTSTVAYLQFRLRASGTDATTNYSRESVWGLSSSSTPVAGVESAISVWNIEGNGYNGDGVHHMQIFRPNVAAATLVLAQNYGVLQNVSITGGRHSTASAYDGMSVFPNTGTITGTLRVYGYRN